MIALIHTVLGKILSLVFPSRCAGCGKDGDIFCQKCINKTLKNPHSKVSVLFLDKLYHWGIYENEILSRALRRFKYYGAIGLADIFSDLLVKLIEPNIKDFAKNTVVLAIPASRARKKSRGYNQAELLAEKFSKKTSISYVPDVLIKSRNTVSQTSLAGRERLFNQKDSFAVANQEKIKNKKIILVDDILTTGATLSEAARALKEAGASEITGLVVAK